MLTVCQLNDTGGGSPGYPPSGPKLSPGLAMLSMTHMETGHRLAGSVTTERNVNRWSLLNHIQTTTSGGAHVVGS